MVDPNYLYELLGKDKWKELIDFLHFQKSVIEKDYHLSHIAKLVESEIIRKMSDYGLDDLEFNVALEDFNLLDEGGFHKMSTENKKLIESELDRRKMKVYKALSKEEHLKELEKFIQREPLVEDILRIKWPEIYNRLFEIIDVKGDAATYFTGPRFINLVRQFDTYHSDYYQYIPYREKNGLSTARKVFFNDILEGLSAVNRKQVIDSILDIVRPYDPERVEDIEILLYGKSLQNKEIPKPKEKPSIFISYSWDDEAHKEWVLNLANRFINDGFTVRLDRYKLRLGSNNPYSLEQFIENSDKVLVIFTPRYKSRADSRTGGVGYEYAIMNSKLYNNQTINEKIIPVLRNGDRETSIPSFMQQYIHIDMREDNDFEANYLDLKNDLMTSFMAGEHTTLS